MAQTSVVHDGVVLVLAGVGVAVVAGAALLLAVEVGGAEVPAARPLHDVASERRHVSHLRRGGVTGSVGQRAVALLDLGMGGDLAEGGERAEAEAIRRGRDAAKAADVADVDELRRRNDLVLHQVEEIDAACFDGGAVAELAEGFIDGDAIDKRELVHACTSCVFPSAAEYVGRGHGHPSHAYSGCVVEGVADGGSEGDDACRLADTCRVGRALRDVVLDQRRCRSAAPRERRGSCSFRDSH